MIVGAAVGIHNGRFRILTHDRATHDVLACFETGYANDLFGAKRFGEFLSDRKRVQIGTVTHVVADVVVHGGLVEPEHVLFVGQRETILRGRQDFMLDSDQAGAGRLAPDRLVGGKGPSGFAAFAAGGMLR
jgi:hypothetical protein